MSQLRRAHHRLGHPRLLHKVLILLVTHGSLVSPPWPSSTLKEGTVPSAQRLLLPLRSLRRSCRPRAVLFLPRQPVSWGPRREQLPEGIA